MTKENHPWGIALEDSVPHPTIQDSHSVKVRIPSMPEELMTAVDTKIDDDACEAAKKRCEDRQQRMAGFVPLGDLQRPRRSREEVSEAVHRAFAETRRLKIVSVDTRLLIDFFNMRHSWEYLCLPQTPELPEGCEVYDIHENFSRGSLDMIVRHPSFDIVPDGAEIPHIQNCFLTVDTFRRLPLPYDKTPVSSQTY